MTEPGQSAQTEVYYYDGQRAIAVYDGSGDVLREVVHGTQYVDEIIRERLAASGFQLAGPGSIRMQTGT